MEARIDAPDSRLVTRGARPRVRSEGRSARRWGVLFSLAVLVGASGCASLGLGPSDGDARSKRRRIPLRVERPEAPVEYEVLVGELAQAEGDFELAREAYERAAVKDSESAFVHERLARLAWQLDDVQGALREAERAFELDPESIRIRLFLGRLYRMRRDFDGLDRVLRDDEGHPIDGDSAYALFQAEIERGDLAGAEALARVLLAMEPDQLRGSLALATVYEKRRDFDEAEQTLRSALETFPDHFLLYMRLAQMRRQRGDRVGEIAVYREVLESHPRHYGILQRLGQAQIEGNDLEGAIETYRLIVETYPEDLASLRRLASLEFAAGRYEEAAARLEVVLAREPGQPDLAIALGQIRRAAGDDEAAIRAFELVGPNEASYPDARIQIAAIHEAAGRPEAALAELERLRKIRSDRRLDFQTAALRVETGDFEGGIALLESLLDGSNEDVEVYYQIGVQQGLHGDVDEALDAMQRVLEIDPENANALNYVGYSWAERGENLEEAEQLIQRALEIAPEDGYITDSLGWVYYKMAESLFEESRKEEALRLLDRAQEHLLQASELTGGDSVVSEHLGDVLLLRGDKEGALDYYEEAVGLEVRESEQPLLREKLDRLRRDLGRPATGSEAP
ncbi:MAG: tetratricopeptide repeat protein [Deltaproteobacteria bacterium]|jgi:tetratricopeptide (TPR) repeat protein|nr:tetratricopeptide repeat protein [Deltaproteobacteria bacterium]